MYCLLLTNLLHRYATWLPSINIKLGVNMEFSKHILLRILLPVLTVMISLFIIATTFKVLTHVYTLVNICP